MPYLTHSLPKQILICQTKTKGMTIQMKALYQYILIVLFVLRWSKTGNIFLQLVAQQCSVASWNVLLHVLPPNWTTCRATNFYVASCDKHEWIQRYDWSVASRVANQYKQDGGRSHAAEEACGLFLTLFVEEENRPKKRNRQQYVRDWIARREERGIYHQLVKELEVQSCCVPRDFFRLTKGQFLFLVERLRPLIGEKKEQPLPLNSVRSTVKPDELNWRENFSSQSQAFFSRFVAWQVAAVVVVRATNPKFVAKSRSQVYFAQHVAACNIEILLSDKLFK